MSDDKKKEPFAPEAIASGQRAPPQIPDHELIRKIGGGSYGEVWLARSIMGTYRAVKVVYRESFDHDRPFEREFNGIQRFEPISRSHESQVDILHVGRNEGYFYYVMELADDAAEVPSARCQVSGEDSGEAKLASPPDTWHLTPDTYVPKTLRSELFRRGKLPFEECLPIILSLTTALEHLHKHGLVHRDIKPSNIIFVHGIPKLADIGLVTSVDATRSYVGTEGFLPPEGPGTVPADIYSLGKVLYEMSSGRDRQDFPELPTNLAEMPDRAGMLELNAMVAKACKNDPRQRYQSAAEMHADLLLLQSGKSVRRLHGMERQLARVTRVGVIAALVALLAVTAYIIANSQARRARETSARESKLRQEAESDKQRAKTEAAKSQQVAQFLKAMLESVGPSKALGRDTTMLKEILDKTAERIGKELAGQPEVEMEIRDTLAVCYRDLGLYEKMAEMARERVQLGRTQLGQEHPAVGDALNQLGNALTWLGQTTEAEAFIMEGLQMRRKLLGNETVEVASSLGTLAGLLYQTGKPAQAETYFREALALRRKLQGNEAPDVATTLHNLANALHEQGKDAEAENTHREALALRTKLFGNDHPQVAWSLNSLALVLHARGNLAEAESIGREVLPMQKKFLGDAHPAVALTLNNLAGVLWDEGKLTEAEQIFGQTVALSRTNRGADDPFLSVPINNLGLVLLDQGRLDEAGDRFKEALAIIRQRQGAEHPDMAGSLHNLSLVLREQGKLAEAEEAAREALAIARKSETGPSLVIVCLDDLAAVLQRQNRPTEAEPFAQECLAMSEKESPNGWRTSGAKGLLGGILLVQEKYIEAEPLLLSGYEGMNQHREKMKTSAFRKQRFRDTLTHLAQLYEKTSQPAKVLEWKQKLAEFDKAATEERAKALIERGVGTKGEIKPATSIASPAQSPGKPSE